MSSEICILVLAIIAGTSGTVVGFGIGSLLTPLFTFFYGADLAIAAATIPHAIANGLRCWLLRGNINRDIFIRFGLISAAGGIAGAFLYASMAPVLLARVLGFLLIMTAISNLTGWNSRWNPKGKAVSVLGFISGIFGGLTGNQGGLRAAALTAFHLTPKTFVATTTAVGLIVDVVRLPIYATRTSSELLGLIAPISISVFGVLFGTIFGERVLRWLSKDRFRQLVSIAIGLLGIWFLAK